MKKVLNNEVIKSSAKPWSRLIVTLIFVVVAIMAVLIAKPASGFKIWVIHFESVGVISANGLDAEVTYMYNCAPDEGTPFFKTTVTQESTHSLARKVDPTQGQCTGESRTLPIDLTVVEGHPPFEEGTALACFNGFIVRRITDSGKLKGITNIDGYCQFITLVRE